MTHPAARPALLVIDDDLALLRGLERMLRASYRVTAVSSPSVALDVLAAGATFDLILCDCAMDEMEGAEFRRRLLTVDRRRAHRVVFMTGGSRTIAPDEPYLQKPFDLGDLERLLEQLRESAA